MQNLGEEIAGEYLKYIKKCDFIEYNLHVPNIQGKKIQGEIDVIGIDIRDKKKKKVYICEVAIHTAGLGYVTDKRDDTVNRFMKKFEKDINYAKEYFADYERHFMLWSPIVKSAGATAKNNQRNNVDAIKEQLKQKYGCTLELIINDVYWSYLQELRAHVRKETKEFKSPVLRMMQIEETLKRHLKIQP
jgi:hypothetical protein